MAEQRMGKKDRQKGIALKSKKITLKSKQIYFYGDPCKTNLHLDREKKRLTV